MDPLDTSGGGGSGPLDPPPRPATALLLSTALVAVQSMSTASVICIIVLNIRPMHIVIRQYARQLYWS